MAAIPKSDREHQFGSCQALPPRESDAGPILDATARATSYARVVELRDELREAEAHNDLGRLSMLRQELDRILAQLMGATGLNGRYRTLGSPAERSRLNVGRAIRSAVQRIDACSPSLARHLRLAVKTGMYCVYDPDLRALIDWQF